MDSYVVKHNSSLHSALDLVRQIYSSTAQQVIPADHIPKQHRCPGAILGQYWPSWRNPGSWIQDWTSVASIPLINCPGSQDQCNNWYWLDPMWYLLCCDPVLGQYCTSIIIRSSDQNNSNVIKRSGDQNNSSIIINRCGDQNNISVINMCRDQNNSSVINR